MGTKELSTKLMIDTNSQKFLAALLSLLLGTVINLLTKETMTGSISNVLACTTSATTPAKAPTEQQPWPQQCQATYTVGDDLSVTPASFFPTISLLGLPQLVQCSVKDLNTLQEKTVKISQKEVLGILAASLKSKTILTDLFLPKKNPRCKREATEKVV
ncbi:hypothetical protein VPH35_032953 [Triticum aestivum]